MFTNLTPDAQAHAYRVASLVPHTMRTVALLHDVLEDTDVSLEDFQRAHGAHVMRSVLVLTRMKAETYMGYLGRVARSGDNTAVAVKLADLRDHLTQLETLKPSLEKRYKKAFAFLLQS